MNAYDSSSSSAHSDDEKEFIKDQNSNELSIEGDIDNDNANQQVYFPPVDDDKKIEYFKLEFKHSVEEFYDNFLKDNAPYAMSNFYKEVMGHTNFNVTEWKEIEKEDISDGNADANSNPNSNPNSNTNSNPNSNPNPIEANNNNNNNPEIDCSLTKSVDLNLNEPNSNSKMIHPIDPIDPTIQTRSPKEYVRNIEFIIKLKNVPFIKQSRVHKVEKLKREENKIILTSGTRSIDAPYASYFHVEQSWEILPIPNCPQKCVVRSVACVVFTKSTMLRSTIEKATKEEITKENGIWKEYLTNKGIEHEDYKIRKKSNELNKRKKSGFESESISLSHGLEGEHLRNDIKCNFPIFDFINNLFMLSVDFFRKNPRDCYYIIVIAVLFLMVIALMRIGMRSNELMNVSIGEMRQMKMMFVSVMRNVSDLSGSNLGVVSDISNVNNMNDMGNMGNQNYAYMKEDL